MSWQRVSHASPLLKHMLAEFQQALADLIASPALCIEARRNPDLLRERYQLTELEAKRPQGVVSHPGMQGNCILYRANRLAPLALNGNPGPSPKRTTA